MNITLDNKWLSTGPRKILFFPNQSPNWCPCFRDGFTGQEKQLLWISCISQWIIFEVMPISLTKEMKVWVYFYIFFFSVPFLLISSLLCLSLMDKKKRVRVSCFSPSKMRIALLYAQHVKSSKTGTANFSSEFVKSKNGESNEPQSFHCIIQRLNKGVFVHGERQ